MRRNTKLAVGIALTATTVVLLTYAAKRMAYFFSFEKAPPSAAIESGTERDAGKQTAPVTLTWDAVPHARSYNLYWSHQPGVNRRNGNKIEGVRPPYRFVRVEKGRTYHFVVTAVSDAGESRESSEIVYRADP